MELPRPRQSRGGRGVQGRILELPKFDFWLLQNMIEQSCSCLRCDSDIAGPQGVVNAMLLSGARPADVRDALKEAGFAKARIWQLLGPSTSWSGHSDFRM